MATVGLILLAAAFLLFVLAALQVAVPRLALGWLGMACLTAYWLFGRG